MRLIFALAIGLAISCNGKSGEGSEITNTVTPEIIENEIPVTETGNGANPEHSKTFNSFLERFSKDSLYQISHVKFPLKHTLVQDPLVSRTIETKDSTFLISKANYTIWNLVAPSPEVYGDAVDITTSIDKNNDAVVEISGREGRVHIEFYFYYKENEWVLQEIVDYSI